MVILLKIRVFMLLEIYFGIYLYPAFLFLMMCNAL